jgi:ribosome-associated protein
VKRKLPPEISAAVQAAYDKHAANVVLLDMGNSSSSFTDYFLICSARNPHQSQAISDDIHTRLSKQGLRAKHVEGYHQGEWILMDFDFLVVHIFSERARSFYDLERLWRSAPRIPVEDTH